MASSALAARLEYLQSSATLLSTTAPSTSRYLLQTHNNLQFSNALAPTIAQRSQVCQACGSLFNNPNNGAVEGPAISVQRQQKPSKDKIGKTGRGAREVKARAMVYTCSACSRKTRIALDVKPPRRFNTKDRNHIIPAPISLPNTTPSLSSNTQLPTTASTATSSPSVSGAAPKKRNKARKQTGLSALLLRAKASESSAGGHGLGLMDLMKKS
ncbi:RNAse P Rpr2/Rpp21/SNM1 subunit domain-containing protein [Phlyctema vagabunda]|uniref:RNAse P Rpr2/Rpp21/SNM1 subunit domain-containing protein n=1 Tax=Phlyctema vagabunda TaxID=108571 RepID=A0ABR4PDS4_9HELO